MHSFDDFLMDMKQSKRKNIRQERKKVLVEISFVIVFILFCFFFRLMNLTIDGKLVENIDTKISWWTIIIDSYHEMKVKGCFKGIGIMDYT